MSIIKESIQETIKDTKSSFAIKILMVLGLIFILLLGYFFTDVFSYEEEVISVEPVSVNVKVSINKKDYQDVFYTLNENNDKVFVQSIKNCKVNKKIQGKTVKGEIVTYNYSTFYRSGQNKRLNTPENVFCVSSIN